MKADYIPLIVGLLVFLSSLISLRLGLSVAIVGMPPFGVFTSEFLILTATIKDAPLLTPFLLLGLGIAFAALFRKVQPMVFGDIPPHRKQVKAAHLPVILHMILVLIIGLYMPTFLSEWFHMAVGLLK